MVNVTFDICNGMKNISVFGSNEPPEIKQGMSVVLLLKSIPIYVKITTTTEDKKIFFGKVFKVGVENNATCDIKTGEEVSFSYE